MLKIIADDLGLHERTNEGIVDLLKSRKISGASLMANGQAFDDAIKKIVEFKDNIGIHFVLVDEKSILTGARLPNNYNHFFIKYFLGLVGLDFIRKELEAQIKKIEEAGIKPSFINSHQHLHLLPAITDIIIKIAKDHDVSYIRVVNEPNSHGHWFRRVQLAVLSSLSNMARRRIIKAGLRCNDVFIGFLNAGQLSQKDIDLATKLSDEGKIVELGCHPGYENEELREKYRHWRYNWQKEHDLIS
ncbi:MAG: ChbG/HpnK family deacetylase [bacterium]|nr:ChbG/HpnK family deacetylase [bacterium]